MWTNWAERAVGLLWRFFCALCTVCLFESAERREGFRMCRPLVLWMDAVALSLMRSAGVHKLLSLALQDCSASTRGAQRPASMTKAQGAGTILSSFSLRPRIRHSLGRFACASSAMYGSIGRWLSMGALARWICGRPPFVVWCGERDKRRRC